MSKDGVQAWCPAHVPDWVPAWGFRIFSRRAPALGQLQGRRPQGEKVGISHCSFSESSMVPAQELQNLPWVRRRSFRIFLGPGSVRICVYLLEGTERVHD